MYRVVAVCQKPKSRTYKQVLLRAASWACLVVVNDAKSINDAKDDSAKYAAYSFAVIVVVIVIVASAKMAAAKFVNVNAVAANASMWIVIAVGMKAATQIAVVMRIRRQGNKKSLIQKDEAFLAIISGEPGFEPGLMEPKSTVLPLYYSPS